MEKIVREIVLEENDNGSFVFIHNLGTMDYIAAVYAANTSISFRTKPVDRNMAKFWIEANPNTKYFIDKVKVVIVG